MSCPANSFSNAWFSGYPATFTFSVTNPRFLPVAAVPAANHGRPLATRNVPGGEVNAPVAETSVVPAAVPSVLHRLYPPAEFAALAPK